jgi:5-methylcytosine-specific restriction protein A
MPWAAAKHCPHGHPPFTGKRCPVCASQTKARADAARPSAAGRGYGGAWRKAREAFLSQHQRCASCGAPATVVDHITPHKGDQRLFWSRSNWQALCVVCHGRKTVRQDGGFGRPGAGSEISERRHGTGGGMQNAISPELGFLP